MNYRLTSIISSVTWDSNTVIYNHGSAATHIISNVPDAVLSLVLSGQVFSDALLLTSFINVSLDADCIEIEKELKKIIQQLIKMELIETI